jgi:photosystem II stability/assembly factor-like uncharacterized protein
MSKEAKISRLGRHLVLSSTLVLLVGGCAPEQTMPSLTAPPIATITPAPVPTPVASPRPAPEAIPGGVMTVALASKGDFIVTGEVDGTTGLAYFLDSAGWLHVFDGASLEVAAKEQVLSSVEEWASYDLAVDSGIGKVYVADGPREEILVLDDETLSTLGRIDACGNLAVDSVTHRLYVGRVGVYVADGESGEIIDRIEGTIPEKGMETFSAVPRGVDVYINPGNRHLFVRMDNNTPGSNSRSWLDLYDADDYTPLAEAMPLSYGSSGIPGFDLERGFDYLGGYHPIAGDRILVALDAEGLEVGHLWGVGGNVFFSPRQNLIYVNHVTGWGETWLDVIEPQTMDYLESYPLKASLYDQRNARFYSLDWREPSVTVFDEPTVSVASRGAIAVASAPLPSDLDSLVLSPAFSTDQTLFAASAGSLFASSDAGENWRQMTIPFLTSGSMQVTLSPAYDRDNTMFVGLSCTPAGNGILRSTDGGRNWSRVNSGLSDLGIEALFFSPEYAQDRTVFASGCFDGAFKSTDGGTTWRPLTIDLVTPEWPGERAGQLAISPGYPRDEQLWFLTSPQLYRSNDGGETWRRADHGLEGLELDRLILSPHYEVDKTALVTVGRGIYVTHSGGEDWQAMQLPIPELWVTDVAPCPSISADPILFVAGFDQEYHDRLYRSVDGGRTWVAVGEEFWGESFTGLTLSPLYSADTLVFASTDRGMYRSTDGGQTWILSSVPGPHLVVFSPDFSSDHTVYASDGQALYRSQDGGENWTGLQEAAEPVSTSMPTPAASSVPVPSPTALSCAGLDPAFQSIADRVESARPGVADIPDVGCPIGPAQTTGGAWQMFPLEAPGSTVPAAPGYMIWRSDNRTIYVLPQGDSLTGRTEALVYQDTWTEDMPEVPPSCAGLTPPTGLQVPVRGFGKVWCENNLFDLVGFAYGSEKGADLLTQEAERGLYISLTGVGTFVVDVTRGLALSM